MQHYDVIVIGAGLMGCFSARKLSRLGYTVAVLEAENDVSMGISRSNTAIVYAGYDMKPGTLKARLTVEANAAFDALCSELHVPFKRCGSLMAAKGPRGTAVLEKKYQQGIQNEVPGLRMLSGSEARAIEPELSPQISSALYAPTTGTCNPWQLCLAGAEDAKRHGTEFLFEHEVVSVERCSNKLGHSEVASCTSARCNTAPNADGHSGFLVHCKNKNDFFASVVINASGIAASHINELVAPVDFRLELSRGSYVVLDEDSAAFLKGVVFFEPEEKTKGATLVPTTDGNILLGPSHEALDSWSREDTQTAYVSSQEGIAFSGEYSKEVVPGLALDKTIRNFGTLRPSIKHAQQQADGSVVVSEENIHDFYVSWAIDTPGFLNVAGVKTPGLTCADTLGAHIASMVSNYLEQGARTTVQKGDFELMDTPSFTPSVTSIGTSVASLGKSVANLDTHLSEPSFNDNEILCRCKQVTAGAVRKAIHSELGARTVDGIKRRVGCGLGRCQGGFCMERVMLILAEELGIDPSAVVKDRSGSWIIKARVNPSLATPAAVKVQSSKSSTSTAIPNTPELLIIGGGAAGIATATAAVKTSGLNPEDILLVDRLDALGGILPQCSHRGFGEREHGGNLTGPEFLAPLLKDFCELNIPTLLNTTATSIEPDGRVLLAGAVEQDRREPFASPIEPDEKVLLSSPVESGRKATLAGAVEQGEIVRPGNSGSHIEISPRAIVFAGGCRERAIGSLPITGSRPSGIFSAGAAQRMVNIHDWNIGERIIILGSGDVGMIMAGTLSERGSEVLALVEQAECAGGLKANRERYIDELKIPLLTNSTITQIYGHKRIEGVEVCTRGVSQTLACDTLIVSVELICETELLSAAAHLPQIFRAGNARRVHSFIEGVVADGVAASKQLAAYLSSAPPHLL